MRHFTPGLFLVGLALHVAPSLNAQWTHTEGPPGMTINSFHTNGGVLFAGTEAKGVYKSLDGGATWSPSNTGIENAYVMSLVSNGTYLFAGTLGHGVYRSQDNGGTWTPANNGIQASAVKCMLIAAGYLWAGMIGGIWRSPDNGQTWEDASGGALGSSFIFAMVYQAPRLEVEADNYLFYTEDLGNNWFVDQGSTAFYTIKHFLQQGDTVIAAADGTVFRTTDGLVNWGDAIEVGEVEILGLGRVGNVIYAGHATGVYKSEDWGDTWTPVPSTGLRVGKRFFNQFAISEGVFLLGFEEIGVYRSLDEGFTWTGSLEGLGAHSAIDNCITVYGDTVMSGTHTDGVFRSPDNGTTWERIGTTDPFDTLSNAVVFTTLRPQPGLLLAGTCGNGMGLYRSANNGQTWAHITDGLPDQDGSGFTCMNSLTMSGANVIAATTEGLYYSTDLGLTWNASNITGPITYAAGLAANGNAACVGISSGSPAGIYRSTNGGANWQQVSFYPDVLAIASDGVDHFYAGSFSQNYRSTDNGLSWNPVGPGIPGGSGGFCNVAIGAHVFVGNSTGVYHSDNYGGTFTDANIGLDPEMNRAVQGLAANDTYVFAGVHRNGIWRRPLIDFDITTAVTSIAPHEVILNVWPMPASSTVRISFALPKTSHVRLTVLDASGRSVRVLFDEDMPSGEQQLDVPVDEWPSGAYVLQLVTSNGRTSRALIVAH